MKIHTEEFPVRTTKHDQMIAVTREVADVVGRSGVKEGIVVVHVPHTTAGVTVNENADPDVVHDVLGALDVAVPWKQEFYRHSEDNSAAHMKGSMVGCSQTLLVSAGGVVLGTWQGIYFCEFDGPRTRRAVVRVMGE
jgi:secondary thiamine-phosphate synthase enzyme